MFGWVNNVTLIKKDEQKTSIQDGTYFGLGA